MRFWICKDYGVEEPDFNEVFDGFQVILYNEKKVEVENSIEDSSDDVTYNVVKKSSEKSLEKIVEAIRNNHTITIEELSSLLD